MGGIAVHMGAEVAAAAAPGEVLVSSTVKDLVVGSGLQFQDRSLRRLRGVPSKWRLFAADNVGLNAAPPAAPTTRAPPASNRPVDGSRSHISQSAVRPRVPFQPFGCLTT